MLLALVEVLEAENEDDDGELRRATEASLDQQTGR